MQRVGVLFNSETCCRGVKAFHIQCKRQWLIMGVSVGKAVTEHSLWMNLIGQNNRFDLVNFVGHSLSM